MKIQPVLLYLLNYDSVLFLGELVITTSHRVKLDVIVIKQLEPIWAKRQFGMF